MLATKRFEVIVADRGVANTLWGPLMVASGHHRARVVLLSPADATGFAAPPVEGVQSIARPLTIQHPRLADTQPELPGPASV